MKNVGEVPIIKPFQTGPVQNNKWRKSGFLISPITVSISSNQI
jgi:hypothetical protein